MQIVCEFIISGPLNAWIVQVWCNTSLFYSYLERKEKKRGYVLLCMGLEMPATLLQTKKHMGGVHVNLENATCFQSIFLRFLKLAKARN